MPTLEAPKKLTVEDLLSPSFDPAILDAPLNSGDDDSELSGEQLSAPSSNLIVCQYETVNHKRNKWALKLKHGMMHINGKDYVFKQATGDLQW